MKFTKDEIFKLLTETSSEMGEMAQKPMGEAKFRPIYVQDVTGEVVVGEKKFLEGTEHHKIGYLFHDKVAVIFTCDEKDFEVFFENNPSIVSQLDEQFGENVGFTNRRMTCHKKRAKPFNVIKSPKYGKEEFMTPDTTMGPPKSSLKSRTWILNGGNFDNTGAHDVTAKRRSGLYRLVSLYLEDTKVQNHLLQCGIPDVKSGDENREFLNRHGVIDNNKIEYASLHYHLYDSAEDFVESVISRTTGSLEDLLLLSKRLEDKFVSTHLARRYPKKVKKWDPTKMSKAEYLGKTEIYKLNRYGLQEINPEITVQTEFSINGNLNESNNTYDWQIKFVTRFGEKLKEEFQLGKFSVDKDFIVQRNVVFTPLHKFDDEHPVLYNPEIYSALISGLKEMQTKILSIEPLEVLDLVKTRTELAENEMEKLIESIIFKIK
jgi:hypothetical protein